MKFMQIKDKYKCFFMALYAKIL